MVTIHEPNICRLIAMYDPDPQPEPVTVFGDPDLTAEVKSHLKGASTLSFVGSSPDTVSAFFDCSKAVSVALTGCPLSGPDRAIFCRWLSLDQCVGLSSRPFISGHGLRLSLPISETLHENLTKNIGSLSLQPSAVLQRRDLWRPFASAELLSQILAPRIGTLFLRDIRINAGDLVLLLGKTSLFAGIARCEIESPDDLPFIQGPIHLELYDCFFRYDDPGMLLSRCLALEDLNLFAETLGREDLTALRSLPNLRFLRLHGLRRIQWDDSPIPGITALQAPTPFVRRHRRRLQGQFPEAEIMEEG